MSRSIKKGPYVAPELLKRVEEMNNQFLLEARHILVTVNKRIFGSNLLKLVAL